MNKIKQQSKARFSTVHERMIRAVVNFATSSDNITTTQSIVAFYALTVVIKDKLTTIDNLRSVAARPITGFTEQKNTLKTTLTQTSATIMSAVYAYALQENNKVLARSMKTTRSSLNKMKNTVFVQYIQGSINEVKAIIDSLKDYNVTAKTVTNWQTVCTEFNNSISNPKNAIANRESINKDIQRLLRECMSVLYNECDALAAQFTDIDANYADAYHANRKLNPTHKSTQLRLHITNGKNEAVTTGEVFVLGTDKSGTLNKDGYVLIDTMPTGTHTISLTTTSGTFTYGPFDFKKGKSTTVHVQLTTTATTENVVTKVPAVATTIEK